MTADSMKGPNEDFEALVSTIQAGIRSGFEKEYAGLFPTGTEAYAQAGKALRGTFCYLAYEFLKRKDKPNDGGTDEDEDLRLLNAACAGIEAVQSVSLILDDIQDKDEYRRGKETLYKVAHESVLKEDVGLDKEEKALLWERALLLAKARGLDVGDGGESSEGVKELLKNAEIREIIKDDEEALLAKKRRRLELGSSIGTYNWCMKHVFAHLNTELKRREEARACFRKRCAEAHVGQWLELMGSQTLEIKFPREYFIEFSERYIDTIQKVLDMHTRAIGDFFQELRRSKMPSPEESLKQLLEQQAEEIGKILEDNLLEFRIVPEEHFESMEKFLNGHFDSVKRMLPQAIREDPTVNKTVALEYANAHLDGLKKVFDSYLKKRKKSLEKRHAWKDEKTAWDSQEPGAGKGVIHWDFREDMHEIFQKEMLAEIDAKDEREVEKILKEISEKGIRAVSTIVGNSKKSYLRIARLKTGSLFILPFEAAGRIAKVPENVERRLVSLGKSYGIAMQMQNDLKGFLKDISNGNYTFLVLACMKDKRFADELLPRNIGVPLDKMNKNEAREMVLILVDGYGKEVWEDIGEYAKVAQEELDEIGKYSKGRKGVTEEDKKFFDDASKFIMMKYGLDTFLGKYSAAKFMKMIQTEKDAGKSKKEA